MITHRTFQKDKIQFLLETGLTAYQAEILARWESAMLQGPAPLVLSSTQNLKGFLQQLFHDVANTMTQGSFLPPTEEASLPLHAAENEILAIMTGEEIILQIFKMNFQLPMREWLRLRARINKAFHEILAEKAAVTCEQCRCTLNQELSGLRQVEADLEESQKMASESSRDTPEK